MASAATSALFKWTPHDSVLPTALPPQSIVTEKGIVEKKDYKSNPLFYNWLVGAPVPADMFVPIQTQSTVFTTSHSLPRQSAHPAPVVPTAAAAVAALATGANGPVGANADIKKDPDSMSAEDLAYLQSPGVNPQNVPFEDLVNPMCTRSRVRTADGKYRYQCPMCKKVLSTHTALARHIRAGHFKQRVHECTMCQPPKFFPQKSTLDRHIRTHTKQYIAECEVCHQQFTDMTDYKRHMAKKHNGTASHWCPVQGCKKGFFGPKPLKKHLMNKHKKTIEIEVSAAKTVVAYEPVPDRKNKKGRPKTKVSAADDTNMDANTSSSSKTEENLDEYESETESSSSSSDGDDNDMKS